MTWTQYIFKHLIPTWFQSFRSNIRIWADLMGSNYANYALMKEDDPEAECLDWFWTSLNEDDTYPKEFLEYLQKLVDDIESGKEKLVPFELEDLEKLLDDTDELD